MATDGALEVLRDMRRLTALVTRSDEQLEAQIGGLNALVRFLTATVDMPPVRILGDILIAPDPPADSDTPPIITILQVALIAPHGVGLVFWSPAAQARAQAHPDGIEGEAANFFKPYEALGLRGRRIVHAYFADLHKHVDMVLRGKE
jgi:hypothetical protein